MGDCFVLSSFTFQRFVWHFVLVRMRFFFFVYFFSSLNACVCVLCLFVFCGFIVKIIVRAKDAVIILELGRLCARGFCLGM